MTDSHIATSDSDVWTQTSDLEAPDTQEGGEEMSEKIACFIRLCWARRTMIVLIVVAGILVSITRALLLPNTYTSTTTLMPPDSASPIGDIMSMFASGSSAASLGGEALGLNTPGELFISILGSRNVQDGLIARFDLMHYYNARLPDEARRVLESSTKIDEDRKSGVISISVSAGSPQLAAKLANGYVDELNRVVTDDSTSSARRERIFLEGRVKDVKRDLDDASKALSQFSTKSKAIDISSQAKSMVDAQMRLEAELIDGRSQLAALRQNYSEDNYRVKAVEGRNAELQKQIDAMGGTPNKGNTAASNGFASPTVGELPALGLTYYDLDRTVRVDEALWEDNDERIRDGQSRGSADKFPRFEFLMWPTSRSGSPRRLAEILWL